MPLNTRERKSRNPNRGNPTEVAQPKAPNWPPLTPLIPTENLTMEPLLPDQVFIIPNFFTSSLCQKYVSFLSTLPLVTTPAKPKNGDAVRVNDRFEVNDAGFAERLWLETGLKEIMSGHADDRKDSSKTGWSSQECWGGEVCGLNPRIRVYRYVNGQFFAQHCRFNTWTFPFFFALSRSYFPTLLFMNPITCSVLALLPSLLPLVSQNASIILECLISS